MTGDGATMWSPLFRAVDLVIRTLLVLAPWCGSLYLQAWLEHAQVWAVDQPFRGLISVALLALGMVGSFLLVSRLFVQQHPRR